MNKRKHHSTENKNYRQKGIHTYISVNIYIYIYRERERERGINVRDTIFSQLLT